MDIVKGPNAAGLFSVVLKPCTAAVLTGLTVPSGCHAWLRGYRPESRTMWWQAQVPLRRGGGVVHASVRALGYDMQVPFENLVHLLPDLEHAGVDLYVMNGPVPDTLTVSGLNAEAATRVLLANGLVAHFDLPHANEAAVLASPSSAALESWLSGPLGAWALESAG